jgi:hypothetical protein
MGEAAEVAGDGVCETAAGSNERTNNGRGMRRGFLGGRGELHGVEGVALVCGLVGHERQNARGQGRVGGGVRGAKGNEIPPLCATVVVGVERHESCRLRKLRDGSRQVKAGLLVIGSPAQQPRHCNELVTDEPPGGAALLFIESLNLANDSVDHRQQRWCDGAALVGGGDQGGWPTLQGAPGRARERCPCHSDDGTAGWHGFPQEADQAGAIPR